MIEKTVVSYLKTKISVPVYMGEIPSKHPQEYVVLKSIDGGRVNHIDAATFSILSYSSSLQKAAELNLLVKNAMYDIVTIDSVSSSKCGGGGQDIDTMTKSYAYECIFNLFYME